MRTQKYPYIRELKPTEPTKQPIPEILKIDLDAVKISLQKFNDNLDTKSLEIAKNTVDDESKHIGHYIKELENGQKYVNEMLDDKTGKRKETLSKLEALKAKLDSSTLSKEAKKEIEDLYTESKSVLDDGSLNELSRSIIYLKSELIRFQSEVYGSTGATSKLLNSIDSIINSSTTKIDKSKY